MIEVVGWWFDNTYYNDLSGILGEGRRRGAWRRGLRGRLGMGGEEDVMHG